MARYNFAGAAATAEHKFSFLAGPGPFTMLEGDENLERIGLLRFEDRAAAEAWYNSPAYTEARIIRQGVSDTFMVMIDSAPGRD